jgi:AraC-like DNA-binding protein
MESSVFHSLEMIERHISEKLTVARIAGSVHFSKYHYQRLFREIVGDSVMSYVTKRKLSLAGKRLLETDKPILEIALEFGFDSHEGFTRSFKAYMGATPASYRKYKLNTIKNEPNKRGNKTMNKIIKELNGFIVSAKETAEAARKINKPFWGVIADKTDALAQRVTDVLSRITAIAENPDEITSRFAIIKIIEETAFATNLMALNTALAAHRGQVEPNTAEKILSDSYYKLASTAQFKARKAAEFFNELSSLIFEDMRKTAAEKISNAAQKGKTAAAAITGRKNIKYEVEGLINRLQGTSLDKSAAAEFDGFSHQLDILMFTLEIDLTECSENKNEMLTAVQAFKESLNDAVDFLHSITKAKPQPASERDIRQAILDFAYQGNILLFYTRGEIEKSAKNTDDFDEITETINRYIQTAHTADITELKKATKDLKKVSTALENHGGAFRVLGQEFENLAERVSGL